jgi:hypothetical protein
MCERLAAFVAGVGLLLQVHSKVFGKVTGLRKRLSASDAWVGLLAGMHTEVLDERPGLRKNLVAFVTGVGFVTLVHPKVRCEIAGSRELNVRYSVFTRSFVPNEVYRTVLEQHDAVAHVL